MKLYTAAGASLVRIGLGAREDRFPEGVAMAARRGVNFFFFYHLGGGAWAGALRAVAAQGRDEIAIATGSGSRDTTGLRRALAGYLEALATDYLDVFFAEYVHPDEDPERIHGDEGTLAELSRWKDEGLIRYVGATAHDRNVSRRLAEDPRVDVLMQRYNMAHRKAALEVFPACRQNGVSVVAFTATRWGSLPAGHPEWRSAAPSALDCYRFCAACPNIDVVLAAPADARQLAGNMEILDLPEMPRADLQRWRRYGDLVYGAGKDGFETDWP